MSCSKNNGFTLVEMLIVIVIIGILSVALIPRIIGMREIAYDIAIEKEVKDLQTALMLYHSDYGNYPDINMASTCVGYDAHNTNWNNLMSDLAPYMKGNNKKTSWHPWPYCIFYFNYIYGRCYPSSHQGYSIVFATKRKTFDDYTLYGIEGEGNMRARYCAYPIDT